MSKARRQPRSVDVVPWQGGGGLVLPAGSGQFDGQRQPIQPLHDLFHHRRIVVGPREGWLNRTSPCIEEGLRFFHTQRIEIECLLSSEPQQHSTGDHEDRLGCALKPPPYGLRSVFHHLFEIVQQNESAATPRENIGELLFGIVVAKRHIEGLAHGGGDGRLVKDLAQVTKPNPAWELLSYCSPKTLA